MKTKYLFLIVPIFIAALLAAPVMADYLGPDRTVTEERSVCKVVLKECRNQNGTYKYVKIDDWACSLEAKPWLAYSSNEMACFAANVSYKYWYKTSYTVTGNTTYPPATIAGELQNCNLQNGWCNTSPSLSLSGDEPVDGYVITAIEGTRNGGAFSSPGSTDSVPLAEGTNNFTFWALSSWGDSSLMGSLSAQVDTTPPQVSLAINGTAGASGWYVSPVTVSVNASDSLSGVVSANVSSGGDWLPSLTLPDGQHAINLEALDVAGNEARTRQTVRVDTVKPDIFISAAGALNASGWYTSSVELSATASDQTSGVDGSAQVSTDGGSTWHSVITLGSGVYPALLFRARDVAGNEITIPFSAKIDLDAPSISVSENGRLGESGWYVSVPTITATATDITSGVASVQHRVDGSAWEAGASVTVNDGTHIVDFQVFDLAGNTQTSSRTLRVDTIAPLSSFSPSVSGAVFSGTVHLSGPASDTGSGVGSVEVSPDGSAWLPALVSPTEWGMAWDTSNLPNGDHGLLVRARDTAGNTSLPVSVSVVLNNHPPRVALSSLWPVTESGVLTFQADVTPLKSVRVEVKDPISKSTREVLVNDKPRPGESRLSVSWPLGGLLAPPGTYPVEATVCDIYNLCSVAYGAILIGNAPATNLPPVVETHPGIQVGDVFPTDLPSIPVAVETRTIEPIQIDPFPDEPVSIPPPVIVVWPLFLVATLLLMYAFLLLSDPRPAALWSLARTLQPFMKTQE